MPRHRLDLSTAEAPQVTAVVTTETRDRVIELATAQGISRSAVMRASSSSSPSPRLTPRPPGSRTTMQITISESKRPRSNTAPGP